MGFAPLALRPERASQLTVVFVAGPLRHETLRAVVLGADCGGSVARLLTDGQSVEGLVLPSLTGPQLDRLAYYQTATIGAVGQGDAEGQGGILRGIAVFGHSAGHDPGLDAWNARWAATALVAAREIMAQFAATPAAALRARQGQIMTRAGAGARAAVPRPETETLRRRAMPGDVENPHRRWPYANYFAVEEHDLRFRRFDGAMSPLLDRAVFISGDAAVVLPYDPVRDRVLVIEQFRVGPFARGDANPWLIEAVAGRIDGGETPEEAARREAGEEAGLTLRALIAGPRYYPSPAAKAEYIYSFIGIADLPDEAAGLGGLASEAEDIRSHVIGFDRFMALLDSGEIDNAPLQLLALWLARERPRLRQA